MIATVSRVECDYPINLRLFTIAGIDYYSYSIVIQFYSFIMDKKYLMIPMGLFAALCTATAGTVIEEGFESGAGSWSARGGETIAGSSTVAHTGTKSLKVSSRGNYWNGPALSSSKFVAGGTYDVVIRLFRR